MPCQSQSILQLQRMYGNRHVQRLLNSAERARASGTPQAGAEAAGPGGGLEQEAERVGKAAARKLVDAKLPDSPAGENTPGGLVQQSWACGCGPASGGEREACRKKGQLQLDTTDSARPSLQRECAGGTWNFEYDGCSIPASIAGALGIDPNNPAGGSDTQFGLAIPSAVGGKACDRHDECYQTCNPFGKSACDQRFLVDMLSICARSSESPSIKASCVAWANAYFEGVSVGGAFAFGQRQGQVCSCSLF
jgi:hypothetical protein